MADDFNDYLEAFKKKHPAWFGMSEVKKGEEGPTVGLYVPKRPLVEPRQRDFTEGDEDRNDV